MDNLHPELRHMVKMFTDSTENSLFKIEYVLDVFVKHQSKLEFGMGNMESFIIDVKSQAQDLPWVGPKEETWMMNQGLNAWQPNFAGPLVELRHSKGQDGTIIPETVQLGTGTVVQNRPAQVAVAGVAVNSAAMSTLKADVSAQEDARIKAEKEIEKQALMAQLEAIKNDNAKMIAENVETKMQKMDEENALKRKATRKIDDEADKEEEKRYLLEMVQKQKEENERREAE